MVEDAGALFMTALPVLVGALIGYVTNAIAIRMLFRPLRAYRVFGLRLPLTPGIIPRRRRALAESIARMVSRELLTPESLLERFDAPSMQDGLRGRTAVFVDWILDTPLSRLIGERARLEAALVSLISSLLSGEQTVLRRTAFALFDTAADLRPAGLFLEGGRLRPGLARLLDVLLEPRRLAAWLDRAVEIVREQNARPGPLPDWLADGLRRAALLVFNAVYEPAGRKLVAVLDSPEVRRYLEHRGKGLVRDVLQEFNPLQRLVIAAAQYDRSINEKMPVLVERLVRAVEETVAAEETRASLEKALGDAVDRIAQGGRVEAVLGVDPVAFAAKIAAALKSSLAGAQPGQGLGRWVEGVLKENEARTMADLASELSGESVADLRAAIVGGTLGFLRRRSDEAAAAAGRAAGGLLDDFGAATPAGLLGLSDDERRRLIDFTVSKIGSILRTELPAILAAFDVETHVIRRIDSLAVEDVERLLMMVLARHLKWINLFGALLGALLGGLQVIVR